MKETNYHGSYSEDYRMTQTPPRYVVEDNDHYSALSKTGYFGKQAAGCLVLAKRTSRIMLLKRSDEVLQPHTWGNCGGAHHEDENPSDAALRELREETNYTGYVELKEAFVYTDKDFTYRNFIAVVPDEFVPEMGWESTDYTWCDLLSLPSPLHFGIEQLLADEISLNLINGS